MGATAALQFGMTVGGALAGAMAYLHSRRSDQQTQAVGNGFANHVLTMLDDIVKRLERLEKK